MIAQDYLDYMKKTCEGSDYPYLLGCRGWDYEMVINNGEFKKTDVVLDTGAFLISFCIYLASKVTKVVTTDNFYWARRDFTKKLPSVTEWMNHVEGLGKGKIKAEEADLQALQYQDNFFDKVVCISTIEHVLDDQKALNEIYRVLKPKGLLLLTTEYSPQNPKDYSEEDGSYYRIYDDDIFQKISNAGFLIELNQRTAGSIPDRFDTLFLKLRK